MKTQIELQGQIEKITFNDDESGFVIARMKVQGWTDTITVVGNLFALTPGEVLKVQGYWHTHPRYGKQLNVTRYETVVPATVMGIERYLGSGMIRGIGPVMAKRLVGYFGVETLNVIDGQPERLYEVAGIGEKRVEMIKNAWDEQKDVRDVMVFLQGHGVSPAYAGKIYRHYGKESIKVVSDNPYRLAMDIFGIGFVTADRIAGQIGIPKDSLIRAEAGIIYVLHQVSDEGHVYYPYELLLEKCSDTLQIETEKIAIALSRIAEEQKIVIDTGMTAMTAVYLAKYHLSERCVANHLIRIRAVTGQMSLTDGDDMIFSAQKDLGIVLTPKQVEAVRSSVRNTLSVITGGPGTGKTTIINVIITIYKKQGRKVLLAAPTGRAAKRMTESTGHEAKTLHRLLEYSPGSGAFEKNDEAPLDAALIVIDETSMVDTILMYHFLKAVPKGSTLVLVGDADQLPSVGPGNVLKDVIDSRVCFVVKLDEIFRQSRQSMIIVNAHRINSGIMPTMERLEGFVRDFYFIAVEEPQEVVREIVSLCKERIPSRYGYRSIEDIQVIAPMHRGTAGVANLNTELQCALNESADELVRSGRVFRSGDKVMQLRNNYDKDVYNGDIGRVDHIDREMQMVIVHYDGIIVKYDYSELDEIALAYAISVHKSQGSEYPVVIIPILTQHYMLLQRNLLYTGITRGKRLVVLVGTKKAIAIAVKNNKPLMRYTALRKRLSCSAKEPNGCR